MRCLFGRGPGPLLVATVILVLAGVLPGMAGGVLAQSESGGNEARVEAVTKAVELLAALEMESDVHQLYDRLHPDVREVLSRDGLGSYAASPKAVIPTAPVEVESVEFGAWRWPVTGERYDDVATVTIRRQRDQDGAAAMTSELHLVEEERGWRWFLGASEAFVEAQDDLAAAEANYQSAFEDDRYADIDRFWAEAFAAVELDYRPVDGIQALSEPAETGCGAEASLDEVAIFYCTLDETVYYNPDFRNEVESSVGAHAWYHIIAHEWGHHIQNRLGIDATQEPELDGGLYAIELELQADCLAGTYAQDAFAREEIGTAQVEEAMAITDVAGDMRGTSWDDPTAHGSGQQRRQALLTGYDDGFLGCDLDLSSAAE